MPRRGFRTGRRHCAARARAGLSRSLGDWRGAVDANRGGVRGRPPRTSRTSCDPSRRTALGGVLLQAGDADGPAAGRVEAGADPERAAALVDDVGFEVASDPAGGADSEQRVAYADVTARPWAARKSRISGKWTPVQASSKPNWGSTSGGVAPLERSRIAERKPKPTTRPFPMQAYAGSHRDSPEHAKVVGPVV